MSIVSLQLIIWTCLVSVRCDESWTASVRPEACGAARGPETKVLPLAPSRLGLHVRPAAFQSVSAAMRS
ncbi:hypothetical protein BD414DRAFT_498728 [Trametes punicea]|nr:hypothetical protein BD414DRAFT_498728 [Trametes punicea]